MTKAPQKLEALEKEMKDEMGEEAPMYQTIGKIAKMFMEQISQGTYIHILVIQNFFMSELRALSLFEYTKNCLKSNLWQVKKNITHAFSAFLLFYSMLTK